MGLYSKPYTGFLPENRRYACMNWSTGVRTLHSPGKPGAENQHAGFDVAGAGNVARGVGLRPTPKGVEGHRTLPLARQPSTLRMRGRWALLTAVVRGRRVGK